MIHFRVGRNSQNLFLRPLPPKEKQQAFIDALVGAVLAAEKSKSTRPKGIWSYINSRRMDYIDFIMGKWVSKVPLNKYYASQVYPVA